MKKMKLFGWKLYLVRLALYLLALVGGMALLAGVLLLFKNPLPFISSLSLGLFFLLALVFGVIANREDGLLFSTLPTLTVALLLIVTGLIVNGGKLPFSVIVYAVIFFACFMLGRILPRKKKHRRSF